MTLLDGISWPENARSQADVIRDMADTLRAFYAQMRKQTKSADTWRIPLIWHMYIEVLYCEGLEDARERYRVMRDWPWTPEEKPYAEAGMKILEVVGKNLLTLTTKHRKMQTVTKKGA